MENGSFLFAYLLVPAIKPVKGSCWDLLMLS